VSYAARLRDLGCLIEELQRAVKLSRSFDEQLELAARVSTIIRVLRVAPKESNDNGSRS